MEDIYDDLDNYDDVNALQELRIENEELKVKLEEHSAAMAKLQKEYDTLEMEFKKLENNYSSLLLTARSEIQRKTQRIAQLNTEKDMMVLKALKNGQKIRRNFNKCVPNPSRLSNEKEPGRVNKKNGGDNVQQKSVDTKFERSGKPDLPIKDKPESGICNKNKSEHTVEKVLKELPTNVNKNIAQQKTELRESPNTSVSNIEDRRRSMPIAKLGSEDELEQNYKTKDARTDYLQTENFQRRNTNKMPIDRLSNKTSETSSLEERAHNYYQSNLRDAYKSRSNRHHDDILYRGRDKYDVSGKHRKHYSPERALKRQHREYQDDYHRSERGRHQGRSLESPPPEYPSRHQRRKSEHRSNYNRYSNDHDKYRYHHDDKFSEKYRFKDDEPYAYHHDDKYADKYRLKDDEPYSKRRRIELYGNSDVHSKEDRSYHEKESIDVQHTDIFSPHEYDMLRFSCQSPDFVHTDATFENPTKEIRATAATPLEDPRVTSKRYSIWKENGKEILSTVVGRNIDIKSVNTAFWDINKPANEPVEVPTALVRRPSQCSDDFVKDIYMDIDNPVPNLSMESGEVHETDYEINAIHSKPQVIQHDTDAINEQVPNDRLKQATNLDNHMKSDKYRIPKKGENNKNTQSKMDVPIIELDENVPHHKKVHKKHAENSVRKELPTRKQSYGERKDCLFNKINSSKLESKKIKSREKGEIQNQATKMAIVADDLEMSDDNSDHMDTNRRVVPEKVQENCDLPLNIKATRTDDTVNKLENKTRATSHDTENKKTVDTAEMKNVEEEKKTKEYESTKKHKIKKKKSKSREMSKDSIEATDATHVSEKKTKSKKEKVSTPKETKESTPKETKESSPKETKESTHKETKESTPKETKERFSDLFGDSSSLMTPEDLGIPSYLPISEDAQDAVDMKINQFIDASSPAKGDNPSYTQTHNRIEVTIQENTAHDDIPTQQLSIEVEADKELKDVCNKKKKPPKNNEDLLDPKQLPSPIVYENLNPGTDLNDPNVVKTVIISTGKQPEIPFNIEVEKPATNVEVYSKQNTANVNTFPAVQGLKSDSLKALATSTPQKEFTAVNPVETNIGRTDNVCDPEVSRAVATIPSAEQVSQTETNAVATNDAPDVRIFVKRRRKVLKRPPMT